MLFCELAKIPIAVARAMLGLRFSFQLR